jgi:hypothetical protein
VALDLTIRKHRLAAALRGERHECRLRRFEPRPAA